jgi:hypothetical protein
MVLARRPAMAMNFDNILAREGMRRSHHDYQRFIEKGHGAGRSAGECYVDIEHISVMKPMAVECGKGSTGAHANETGRDRNGLLTAHAHDADASFPQRGSNRANRVLQCSHGIPL